MKLFLVNDEDSIKTARLLAQKEGIFCGISAGATMRAAILRLRKHQRTVPFV